MVQPAELLLPARHELWMLLQAPQYRPAMERSQMLCLGDALEEAGEA